MLPLFDMVFAQIVEHSPRVKTGVVTIVKNKPDGVVADRLYRLDVDVFFADLQHVDPVTADFRRWGVNAQVFARQTELFTIIEVQLQ